MPETNLFPAFEGPEGKNLHTKGIECECRPYYRKTDRHGEVVSPTETGDVMMTVRHRPLTPENIANPPTWITQAESEGDWEGGNIALSNGETLVVETEETIPAPDNAPGVYKMEISDEVFREN